MTPFATLLEALVFTPGRTGKLSLLKRYFQETPDPDRGYALAALCGTLDLPQVTPALIRGLVEERVDPVLFRLSYDFVGDLAETVSLIWPAGTGGGAPTLSDTLSMLRAAGKAERPGVLSDLLDRLGASERFALIKLCTGGMRVGVSARLARVALAEWSGRPVERIEELWFALTPPYADLFHWLEGGTEPDVDLTLAFRPAMLAHPLDEARLPEMDPADYIAERKWDGVRVQAVAGAGGRRVYTRTGEDISAAFPDLIETMDWTGAVDGELLILRDGAPAPFADLQKRLGRKRVGAKTLAQYPAHIRAYDLLADDKDAREAPLSERRARLEAWFARTTPARMDLSGIVSFDTWDTLADIRAAQRGAGEEGLMLKRKDAPYVAGRPTGLWWKWKRDPLTADCVLMYAQRGHGKRSSLYSDYTFGAWTKDGTLAPVGKAYSGFTDQELSRLDAWVRANMTERFGPVRAVRPGLVLEVAFDDIHPSTRHKSGVAMRFPRIARIRWDKPVEEAEQLSALRRMAGLEG